jgi:hypothetical protein
VAPLPSASDMAPLTLLGAHSILQPATYFLKKAAGIEKGTPTPGKATVGQITLKQIYGIAQIKQNDPTLKVSSPFPPAAHASLPPS